MGFINSPLTLQLPICAENIDLLLAQTIVVGLTELAPFVLLGLRHHTPIEAPAEIANIITLTMAKFTEAHAKDN